MPTYGKILQELGELLTKTAFIPSPNTQQTDPSQGQQPGGQEMQQLAQQLGQGGGQGMGGPQPMSGGQQDSSQGQPEQPGQEANQGEQAPPGGDLTPQSMAKSLTTTPVTVSVAELLDLVSGGKASQAHLKTESMKVQHGFKHKKMLRDEQRKEQEDQQKQQQQQMMQQQQQSGMMGGGIYSGGAMDGSQPGQGGSSGQGGGQQQVPQPGMQ
jgi:hypothetical protein